MVADLRGAEEAAGATTAASGSPPTSPTRTTSSGWRRRPSRSAAAIDLLVNNAGLYASLEMRPFDQIPLEEWRRVMDVNVASMFLTAAPSCR